MHWFSTLLRTYASIVRFLVVGVFSLTVDYSLLLIQYHVLHVQLDIATTIAFLIGLLVNFSLNKFWTFQAPRGAKQSTKQAVQYAVLVCVNLFFTNLIVLSFAKKSIGPEISKPISTALVMVLNYVVYQKIIFKNTDEAVGNPS